jgi:tetratricopeptide (TPR) repeat protein
LVRVFAKPWNDGDPASNAGVPIVLEPTREIDESSTAPRNSVSEVYAQAIKDLSEAEASLPESNGVYATKAAAAAMLARVYLQQGDYTNAVQAANRAIESATANGVSLTSNYADAFSETNSSEDIFATQVNSSSGYNGFQEFFSSVGRGDIQIQPAHFSLYESGDERLEMFYEDGGSTYTGKFDYVYGNVHVIRLAEMYLIRAESNFRLGSQVGAAPVEDINKIRMRAGLDPYEAGELTLEKILLERRLELAFEGFTLQDNKRLQIGVGNLAWNSDKLVFPIPQRELRVNPNLSQNSGY